MVTNHKKCTMRLLSIASPTQLPTTIGKCFGTLGMPPIEIPLRIPSCKIETNVLPSPFQFIDMGVELWAANHMGWNSGAIGNILGNTSRTWELFWEHNGNTLGTMGKKSLSPWPLKKEKTGPFMSACWAFPLAAWNYGCKFSGSAWIKLFLRISNLLEIICLKCWNLRKLQGKAKYKNWLKPRSFFLWVVHQCGVGIQ